MARFYLDPKQETKRKRDIELLPEPLRTKYKRMIAWFDFSLRLLFFCGLVFVLGFTLTFIFGLAVAIKVSMGGLLLAFSMSFLPVWLYWVAEFGIARTSEKKNRATLMLCFAVAAIIFTNYMAFTIIANFDKIFH